MLFEGASPTTPAAESRAGAPFRTAWRFLASNDTGLVLAVAVALLLAIGSLVRNAWPEKYEALSGDDFTFFLRAGFRTVDIWFWLLFAALGLLGLSLFVVGTDTAFRRLRRGVRDLREYGPPLAHWGAALALLAHAVGGLSGTQDVAMALPGAETRLGPLSVRLVALDTAAWPDGTPRRWDAVVDVVTPDGLKYRRRTAPNAPATWDFGMEMLLLMRVVDGVPLPTLDVDGTRHPLSPGAIRGGAGETITVLKVFGPPEFRTPMALVDVSGSSRAGRWLLTAGRQSAPGLRLGVEAGRRVLLSHRRAPGTPILLAAAGLVALGTLLSAGRYLRRRRTRTA